MSVAGAKGGVSGGTLASGMNMFEEMAADPQLPARWHPTRTYSLPVDLRSGRSNPDSDVRNARRSIRELGRAVRDGPDQQCSGASKPCAPRAAVGERLHVRRIR